MEPMNARPTWIFTPRSLYTNYDGQHRSTTKPLLTASPPLRNTYKAEKNEKRHSGEHLRAVILGTHRGHRRLTRS
jgi:hypothetical protein